MVRHLLHRVPKSLHHTGLHHQRTQLTWQREREGMGREEGRGGEGRGWEEEGKGRGGEYWGVMEIWGGSKRREMGY